MSFTHRTAILLLVCLQMINITYGDYGIASAVVPAHPTNSNLSTTLNATSVQGNVQTLQRSNYFTLNQVTLKSGEIVQEAVINGPPSPPVGYELERQMASLPTPNTAAGINTLTVPAYNWVFGCSSVSGAMIAAFYDRNGYPNIYTGPTNGGVMPLDNNSWPTWSDGYSIYPSCPLIASKNGVDGRTSKGSIDDYWVKYNSSATDPHITNSWTQHTWGDAIGDYMKTSQSAYGNTDGSTTFWYYTSASKMSCSAMAASNLADGTLGRKTFYEAKGYTVTDCYNQKTDNRIAGGFSFANYRAEIDAGNPVMLNLAGHTVVGIGYDDATQTVYLHDTWDYDTHQMTWGSNYSGMALQSVSIVHLAAGTDDTPDAFSFTDQTDVALSSTITSNEITVSGINIASPISITGGKYSINSGSFTSSAGTVNNGDKIRLQHTSSAQINTNTDTTLTINGVSDTFSSTTAATDTTPDPFSFTSTTEVQLSTVIESSSVTITGIETPSPISLTGGEYSINGGAYTAAEGTINNNDGIKVRHTSAATYSTTTNTILTIGGVSGMFSSTTIPLTHTLKVNKTGTGTGTIAGKGISCGNDCNETYPKPETLVTLTAKTDKGSTFTGWSGDCASAEKSITCKVTVTGSKTVTANFDYITFNLTANKTGNGMISSSPEGINCGTGCTTATYAYRPDTSVTLTATADAGYTFTGWKGCTSKTNICNIDMKTAKTVTASFAQVFTLSVNKTGNGSGKVTGTGINCGASVPPDCTEDYLTSSNIKLTATPDAGHKFTGWTGCTSTTNTCKVIMNSAKTVSANFEPLVSFVERVEINDTFNIHEYPSPYVITSLNQGAKLFLLGSRHANSVTSATYKTVKYIVDSYNITHIILEGVPTSVSIDQAFGNLPCVSNPSQCTSEMHYAYALGKAKKTGITFKGGEAGAKKEYQYITTQTSYEAEDYFGFLYTRDAIDLNSSNQMSESALRTKIDRHRLSLQQDIGITITFNYDDWINWYKEKMQVSSVILTSITTELLNPNMDTTIINRISREMNIVRDTNLIETIKSQLSTRKNILVVYGSGHISTIYPEFTDTSSETPFLIRWF